MQPVEIVPVQHRSITEVRADYVLLKNAEEGLVGPEESVDRALGGLLALHNIPKQTAPGQVMMLPARGAIASQWIILVGIGSGIRIDYSSIRLMCQKAVEALATHAAEASTLATVSHGIFSGLDHREVFYTQLFSLKDALERRPSVVLRQIFFNEITNLHHRRLSTYLESLAGAQGSPIVRHNSRYFLQLGLPSALAASSTLRIERAETAFIAMPFREEFENLYDFGLRLPIVDAGLLPIRLDKQSFVGSISEEIKRRIRDSSLVIADVTDLNPNVLFELGLAQGYGKSTIILARVGQELPFDLRDARIVSYNPFLLRELNAQIVELIRTLRPATTIERPDDRLERSGSAGQSA